jgi:hypothetical protein
VEIIEEVDKFKRNKKLKELAGNKIRKRYRLKDIKDTIRSNNNPMAHAKFKAARGTFFQLKDVINAGVEWKVKNPNSTYFRAGLEANKQWLELVEYLKGGRSLYNFPK